MTTDNTQELRVYKDADGKQYPDTIAMSIVYNLGDALYDQLRGKVSPRDFTKARQATNDDFLDHATDLITAYTNKQVEEVLDRLEKSLSIVPIPKNGDNTQLVMISAIEAERNKLNKPNGDVK